MLKHLIAAAGVYAVLTCAAHAQDASKYHKIESEWLWLVAADQSMVGERIEATGPMLVSISGPANLNDGIAPHPIASIPGGANGPIVVDLSGVSADQQKYLVKHCWHSCVASWRMEIEPAISGFGRVMLDGWQPIAGG